MARVTKIEWATSTWSPITGCSPISEGCKFCFAARMVKRFPVLHKPGVPFSRIVFHHDRLEAPLRRRKPRRIFVGSMTDMFHPAVQITWIDRVLEVIAARPQHTFMVLTKRPENMERQLYGGIINRQLGSGDFLPNLWWGVTVESAAHLNRINVLRLIPAAIRFVSFEPLLGRVWKQNGINLVGIDWVIVGCETGPGARPMDQEWARIIKSQCAAERRAFFAKKATPHDKTLDDLPFELRLREFPV